MTLDDIRTMPDNMLSTEVLADYFGINRIDVTRKAYTDDPYQRWPFNFTFCGNRLKVPKEALVAWAQGGPSAADIARLCEVMLTVAQLLQAALERDGAGKEGRGMILMIHEVNPAETYITAGCAGELMRAAFEKAEDLRVTEDDFAREADFLIERLRCEMRRRRGERRAAFDYETHAAKRREAADNE